MVGIGECTLTILFPQDMPGKTFCNVCWSEGVVEAVNVSSRKDYVGSPGA